jgi:hypothetical protein
MDLMNGLISDSLDFPDTLYNGNAKDISVASDGKYISVCASKYPQLNANYVIYNTKDRSIFTRIFVDNGSPYISAFSLDSRYFFFNELKGNRFLLKMLNLETKEVKTIHIADNPVTDIKFSDDGIKMLFAREKGILGIYNLEESKLDTIIIESKYDYGDRSAEFINDNFILLTTRLGFGLLNRSNNQITIFSSTRAGLKRLFHDNNTFFYASGYWAGKVTGISKIITGVKTEDNNEILYPNPTTNTINLKMDAKFFNGMWQLTDLTGQILLKGEIENNENFHLDITNLPVQTYFLRISNGKDYKVEKVIKW